MKNMSLSFAIPIYFAFRLIECAVRHAVKLYADQIIEQITTPKPPNSQDENMTVHLEQKLKVEKMPPNKINFEIRQRFVMLHHVRSDALRLIRNFESLPSKGDLHISSLIQECEALTNTICTPLEKAQENEFHTSAIIEDYFFVHVD